MIGFMVGASTATIAANEYIQATISKFNIQVNGQESVEVTALVSNGISHYGIRDIVNLTGGKVDYIDDTRTIVIETTRTEMPLTTQTIAPDLKEGDKLTKEQILFGLENIKEPLKRAYVHVELLGRRLAELLAIENPNDEYSKEITRIQRELKAWEEDVEFYLTIKAEREEQLRQLELQTQ